ncbi:helix-turn-helix domain-containing protein [Phaeobacter porticola]|uniref:Transcription regulator, AraC family n=1 Tax=Phaeobacter porticola TaxID=1844006 RepID=A0A1L3I2R5_9RHOB|nr:AraC family transcriptional regulator [Phaeobacter porticola]APG46327.1 transcription regulator, AraC family [Phaeobacter porticola]
MDRLTTLIKRFQLRVGPVDPAAARLLIVAEPGSAAISFDDGIGGGGALLFCTEPVSGRETHQTCADKGQKILLAMGVSWSRSTNPFLAALPDCIRYPLQDDPAACELVRLIVQEDRGGRCGADSVVSRLGEILMVRLLRDQIARGSAEPGLIAGLGDPRLSRAIVAIHDHPGKPWSNDDLACEAGLSRSRFAEVFAAEVGETPMGYLRRWRLILARQDLVRGDRVDAVARRYAYGSSEGFTRAFRKAHGVAPVSLRKAVA